LLFVHSRRGLAPDVGVQGRRAGVEKVVESQISGTMEGEGESGGGGGEREREREIDIERERERGRGRW
jgi:hypothetical protein